MENVKTDDSVQILLFNLWLCIWKYPEIKKKKFLAYGHRQKVFKKL